MRGGWACRSSTKRPDAEVVVPAVVVSPLCSAVIGRRTEKIHSSCAVVLVDIVRVQCVCVCVCVQSVSIYNDASNKLQWHCVRVYVQRGPSLWAIRIRRIAKMFVIEYRHRRVRSSSIDRAVEKRFFSRQKWKGSLFQINLLLSSAFYYLQSFTHLASICSIPVPVCY